MSGAGTQVAMLGMLLVEVNEGTGGSRVSRIFIAHDGGSIPLWRKNSGFEAAGLDFLTGRGKEWYARRKRTLKRGDCVAVCGRGIAVVEHVDETRVLAVLGKRESLRLMRKDIAWNDANSRWEANVRA